MFVTYWVVSIILNYVIFRSMLKKDFENNNEIISVPQLLFTLLISIIPIFNSLLLVSFLSFALADKIRNNKLNFDNEELVRKIFLIRRKK